MIDKMYILHQRIMLTADNKTKFTLVTFLFLSLSIGVSSCKSADATQKSVDCILQRTSINNEVSDNTPKGA